MPVKWYDEQGKRVVEVLEEDFSIPIDPMSEREGIYHSGWAFRRGGVWNTGSAITIYGVKDSEVQNQIIQRIKDLVKRQNYWDVRVSFYDNAKFKKEGNVTRRVDVPLLRQQRIVGKTTSWRDDSGAETKEPNTKIQRTANLRGVKMCWSFPYAFQYFRRR